MDNERASLSEWLEQHGGTVALVFADVVGSTSLLYSRKTLNFTTILRANKSRAAALIRDLGGKLVNETGDEVLAAFPCATPAYTYATELFRDPGHPDLGVRVGMHFGAVSAESEALMGRNVHLGARVMQHALGCELWMSEAAKLALESESPEIASAITWIQVDDAELKGIPEKQRLWRIA